MVLQCINSVSSNPVVGRIKIWQLKNLILTLFGLIFRRIYIYIYTYLVQKRKENKLNISMLTTFSRKRLIYNLILFVLHIRIGHNSVKCQQTNHFNIIVILNIKDDDLRQRIRSYVFFYYPHLIHLSGNFVHNIFLSRSLTIKRSKVRTCRKGLSWIPR